MDAIEKKLLHEVAELDALPVGAYNIRANGQLQTRNTTANIDVVSKDDKPGIDIYGAAGHPQPARSTDRGPRGLCRDRSRPRFPTADRRGG